MAKVCLNHCAHHKFNEIVSVKTGKFSIPVLLPAHYQHPLFFLPMLFCCCCCCCCWLCYSPPSTQLPC